MLHIDNRKRVSLVPGKYLSADFYVGYGIGLFEALNTFGMHYRRSRRWTVKATSGLRNSNDFVTPSSADRWRRVLGAPAAFTAARRH